MQSILLPTLRFSKFRAGLAGEITVQERPELERRPETTRSIRSSAAEDRGNEPRS